MVKGSNEFLNLLSQNADLLLRSGDGGPTASL